MKTFNIKLSTFLTLVLLLGSSCGERFPDKYVIELPSAPEAWTSLFGYPHWRVEWLDPNGQKQILDIRGNSLKIELPVTWANPVTAWPYWPDYDLIPGIFKPAGGLFPFDTNGSRLYLSWEAGADTVFYWELLYASQNNLSRFPANFDWLRFRELFLDTLSESVRSDPWLVNWRSVAERTAAGNFDRRRLVPEPAETRVFPVPAVTWYGSSPFSKPLVFQDDEIPEFPVRPGLNVWISSKGILKVNNDVWVFIERQ
ncbi:MAG: hypothetical protein FWD14_07280 [Treponema sp.]|nr:hypothetical protein [Treponema sp.]